MANLAQFDIGAKQQEARTRALLEDLLVESYRGTRPHRLALAIWWAAKEHGTRDQHVLCLYAGLPINGITDPEAISLYWKMGNQGPPFVWIEATDVDYFSELMKVDPGRVARYQSDYEVLYFDKTLLTPGLLNSFRIITEPSGLMRGWYIDQNELANSGKPKTIGELLAIYRGTKPNIGLVKTEEKDFDNCRGLLHIESSQLWVPMLPDAVQSYRYYTDWEQDRRVYFLFEGGALYQVLQFEFKTEHDYASRFGLLRTRPDDRYVEVYLRAVRPPAQPKA
jgi:hypothetical protein